MRQQRLGPSAHNLFGPVPDGALNADQAPASRMSPGEERATSGQATGVAQVLGSLAITFISVGLLLGSFLLSQLDASGVRPSPTSVAEILPSPTLVASATPTPLPSPTRTPSPPPTATETAHAATETPLPVTETRAPPIPTPSPTLPSALIPSCSPPAGWIAYTVQRGETLYILAWRTGVTVLGLMEANCLSTQTIYAGQRIYLPPTAYASATPRPFVCGPPLGWVAWYTVQPGDTLSSLSRRFGVSIEAIRRANCLDNYTIYIGTLLYLPPPTPTPIRTSTPTPVPTHTPTGTPKPSITPPPTPTGLITITPSPTPTGSPTIPVTLTPIRTVTYTPTPTETPEITLTPTPTESPMPTYTPTPPPTEPTTPTPTPTEPPSMATPTPTLTPTSADG